MEHRTLPQEIAVVVLNWNAVGDTIRCVRSLMGWRTLRPDVWIVDNASTGDDVARLTRAFPQAHILSNERNLGFAGGTNRGIQAALEQGDLPVLLLNNDAQVAEADLQRLLETLYSDEEIGFVGPLLYEAAPTGRLLAAGGRNPVLHHQSHIFPLKPGPAVRTVAYVPGTVALVRPELFRRVGLLDERYFFSMEVADLCLRAARQGYRNVVDTRAKAVHALERSAPLRGTLHVYYIIRNRFLFIRNFYRGVGKAALFFAWTAYSVALWLKLILQGAEPTARAVRLGLEDGLRGRFGGQNERVLAFVKGAG